MEKRIYKYVLKEAGWTNSGRISAKVIKPLSVQLQNGILTFWAVVDVDENRGSYIPIYEITERVTGGLALKGGEEYIGTVQDGDFVGHYFGEQIQ